jgi:hypothetical protein
MAQQLAGRRTRAAVILKGHFAIDDDPLVTFGPLYPTPFVTGQVVDDFDRQHVELVEIVDNYISRRASRRKPRSLNPAQKAGRALSRQ